jgi:HK97 family phage major capsid protein
MQLDAAANWLAEAADITETDPTIGEEVVTPLKVGALTKVSNELANDSSPAATSVVGDGLVRSIARKVDLAFFGNTTPLGPNGLQSLTGIATVTAPGSAWSNFDWAIEAQSQLERVGSTVTAFAASFETVRQLSEVKQFVGTTASSNEPLLQADDVSTAQPRSIFGVPLFSLPEGVIADGMGTRQGQGLRRHQTGHRCRGRSQLLLRLRFAGCQGDYAYRLRLPASRCCVQNQPRWR